MNDLIERSKAVEAIYWEVMEMSNKEMAESILSDVPTVDAEPVRHGYWTECKDSHSFECSVCHTWSVVGGHYCDWCGAKMDAKEETEVWNCSNGRKIVAPKGTFDKLYYSEDE